MRSLVPGVVLLCFAVFPVIGSEADALAISKNIQARHMPFGTILDPMYPSAASNQIVGYTRCGDSALWTGAYLAAEAFRYNVTRSPDALANVNSALAGLKSLADVTGDNRLARCIAAAGSPYAVGIEMEEAANTIHQTPDWIWVDNTSRDQVVGAFFGLNAAFDLVDDSAVRSGVADLVTRLIAFIAGHQWSPNDDISNTFLLRAEELQMLLQVTRHVNPSNPISGPFFVPPVESAVFIDVQSDSSYFKFNLDYMSLYNLVRLQNNGSNRDAYHLLRDVTASHQNAFFNLVDRALAGPDAARDAETGALLNQWLERPRRDSAVDLTLSVPVCGTSACVPVPVALRPPADFLWQDSPFQLSGGGSGRIESSGIDYILPYWMARYYGVIGASSIQSAATPGSGLAPAALASLFGANLASATAQADTQPLPVALGDVTLTVTDADGIARSAPLLYVSPGQINFQVPEESVPGPAQITLANGSASQTFTAAIDPVAPGLFSMNGAGTGVAAATAIAVPGAQPQVQLAVPVFECAANADCVSSPIGLAPGAETYVTFYGTGIRGRSSLANVSLTIHGSAVPVLYAGPTPGFAGLDQVNAALTPALAGAGESDVILTVDGRTSNIVTINIQ